MHASILLCAISNRGFQNGTGCGKPKASPAETSLHRRKTGDASISSPFPRFEMHRPHRYSYPPADRQPPPQHRRNDAPCVEPSVRPCGRPWTGRGLAVRRSSRWRLLDDVETQPRSCDVPPPITGGRALSNPVGMLGHTENKRGRSWRERPREETSSSETPWNSGVSR